MISEEIPSPAEWWQSVFELDFPAILSLRNWIEQDLKRRVQDVTDLKTHREITAIEPDGEYKMNAVGDRLLFEVTFTDGYQDSLHVYNDGRRCDDHADWKKKS